ncbi:MAG: hypothetical protein FWC65_02685 [Treponema sp.]|nr:hypothetical protein [Treponema sp.]
MADKRWFLIAGLLALCLYPVFGQSFFIDRTGDEPRFIQRLAWEDAQYFLRYRVIVEQQAQDGSYREALRETVEENFIYVSLYPGWHRFRVEVYDLLDEMAFSTDWQNFYIAHALQPKLTDFAPRVFYLDDGDLRWEITLRGENLLPQSEFFLMRGNARIIPLSHTSEGDAAHLVFCARSLAAGEFEIMVINPGGLEAHAGTLAANFRRAFDLNISVGFAPIVPLYGFFWNDFTFQGSTVAAPFPAGFYPLGAAARISFIPFRRAWGNLGLDLSGSVAFLEHERTQRTAIAYLLNTHLSLMYQRYFLQRNFAYNIVVGAGITTLMNFHYTYAVGVQTGNRTPHYASALAGFSVMGFFLRPFYISAGADFIHIFSPEGSAPGFIRPSVAAGVRL